MADQIIDEDSQTALPNDESGSKLEGSEKESTQVCEITFLKWLKIIVNIKSIIICVYSY